MITLFAMPKAFRGHLGIIQRNAIQSWMRLALRPEVFLLGTDEGTAAVSAEFGLRHIPEVARNEYGTPLVNDLFAKAESYAANRILCYVNADIILLDDFAVAVQTLAGTPDTFLMVGQRTDIDIAKQIDFKDSTWAARLGDLSSASGILRPPTFIDYFVFTKGLYTDLLPLALGRGGWDNWLIWRARSRNSIVVDASATVRAIHQNHDYSHHPAGAAGVWTGPEAQRNRQLIGPWYHKLTTEDASYRLTSQGLKRSHRHTWLAAKRVWSHPRGVVQLTYETIGRLFRRTHSPTAS